MLTIIIPTITYEVRSYDVRWTRLIIIGIMWVLCCYLLISNSA
jgi:hypothetical protein